MDKSEQEKGKWNLRNSQLFFCKWSSGESGKRDRLDDDPVIYRRAALLIATKNLLSCTLVGSSPTSTTNEPLLKRTSSWCGLGYANTFKCVITFFSHKKYRKARCKSEINCRWLIVPRRKKDPIGSFSNRGAAESQLNSSRYSLIGESVGCNTRRYWFESNCLV